MPNTVSAALVALAKSSSILSSVALTGMHCVGSKLNSNIDTTYFPIDEIDQNDTSAAYRAQAVQAGDDEYATSLPFIGYTYKRFDAYRGP
jgi:hypothetical protein